MIRTARPHRALPEAIAIARQRGKVQVAVRGPEARYHFTIDSTITGAFVRVRFTPRILATPADIAYFFPGRGPAASCDYAGCSPHPGALAPVQARHVAVLPRDRGGDC